MNKQVSVIYRVIPLLMGVFTFSFGVVTLQIHNNGALLAARVLISLTAICIALYTTAATIIRQLIKTYNKFYKYALPTLGYSVSALTIGFGFWILFFAHNYVVDIISGNVSIGIGLIACCVSTVATASTRFTEITKNYKKEDLELNENRFSKLQTKILISIPIICALIAFIQGIRLMLFKHQVPFNIAGHVLVGLSLICASLIWLVYMVVTQINNTYTSGKYKWKYVWFILINGSINILWGIWILITNKNPKYITPAFVLIGLGLICWSISSKVILLTLVWKNHSEMATHVKLIPVFTTLMCTFLALILSSLALVNPKYVIAPHILAGLGAVCFTLFSIVSILEGGTATEDEKSSQNNNSK